jgi:fructose-bisphosphate aldolase class II
MHGSSSVPQELLAEIREFGGDMKETYGVPVEEIVTGIKHGVRKVNIDTDIRLAMTGAIRRYFAENPSKFDPRDYLKPAREAAKKICQEARFEAFGTAGQRQQDQGHPARQDGRALRQGRAEPDRRSTCCRPSGCGHCRGR